MRINLDDLFRLSHATGRQVVVESVRGQRRIHYDGWVYTLPLDEDELLDIVMTRLNGGGGG